MFSMSSTSDNSGDTTLHVGIVNYVSFFVLNAVLWIRIWLDPEFFVLDPVLGKNKKTDKLLKFKFFAVTAQKIQLNVLLKLILVACFSFWLI